MNSGREGVGTISRRCSGGRARSKTEAGKGRQHVFRTRRRVNILEAAGLCIGRQAGRSVGHRTCNNIESRQSYLVVPGAPTGTRAWGP